MYTSNVETFTLIDFIKDLKIEDNKLKKLNILLFYHFENSKVFLKKT